MVHSQRGILPIAFFLTGLILMGLFWLILIVDIVDLANGVHLEYETDPGTVLFRMIAAPLCIFFGYLWMNTFPALKVGELGFEVHYTPFFSAKIPWEDVLGLGRLSSPFIFRSTYCLLIKESEDHRKRNRWIRILHWIPTRLTRQTSPVILISGKTQRILNALGERNTKIL